MKTLLVLVPNDGASAGIDAGSGVVADGENLAAGLDGPVANIYFEGNRLGAVNLQRYEDRLMCAGGRLVHAYPTVARARLPLSMFRVVGHLDVDTWQFFPAADAEEALAAWAGRDWRRPESEQLSVDMRTWERTTGRSLHGEIARGLNQAVVAGMPPTLRAWAERQMSRAGA